MTSWAVKFTVHPASQMGPSPSSVCWKFGITCPVVGKSRASWGMGRVAVAIEVTFSPFATRTMALGALVSMLCMGAARAIYIWVAPESTIPVALVGRSG